MVGLFLKQVSPELLLLELWVLFSQTLCIQNCSLALNGAKGSTAARSSPLLGLPTYFSISRMRWKRPCTLVALSQLRFLQLFLSAAPTSGAVWWLLVLGLHAIAWGNRLGPQSDHHHL